MMMRSDKSPTYAELHNALRLLEVPLAAPIKNPYGKFYRDREERDMAIAARLNDKRKGARPLSGRSKYDG